MGKLCQVIAVVAGKKKHATQVLTEAYHRIQKPESLAGLSRTYRPKDDDGEQLPGESKPVQVRTRELIDAVCGPLSEMYDCVLTQDTANCTAAADVVVDGKTLARSVPVTHLLFLEKQVTDLETFVGKLPVLDASDEWHFDANANCYATLATETVRTKKVPKAFEKSPATDKHPAQVEVFNEDILVGYWRQVKFSGAMPAQQKAAMLDRVRRLREAIQAAREEANSMAVTECHEGKAILDFVFQSQQ